MCCIACVTSVIVISRDGVDGTGACTHGCGLFAWGEVPMVGDALPRGDFAGVPSIPAVVVPAPLAMFNPYTDEDLFFLLSTGDTDRLQSQNC